MTPEEKLEALFAVETPRLPDLAFQAAVMERVAQRRLVMGIVSRAPWVAAASGVLWMLKDEAPLALDALTRAGAGLGFVAATALAALWLVRRLSGA